MSSDLVKIESQHRRRLAVVYVRSSRVPQAPEDLAFVEYQRAQAWHARAWGWPESAVQVIDEDIGRAGRTTEARAGYQKLCAMVAAKPPTLSTSPIIHSSKSTQCTDWFMSAPPPSNSQVPCQRSL